MIALEFFKCWFSEFSGLSTQHHPNVQSRNVKIIFDIIACLVDSAFVYMHNVQRGKLNIRHSWERSGETLQN